MTEGYSCYHYCPTWRVVLSWLLIHAVRLAVPVVERLFPPRRTSRGRFYPSWQFVTSATLWIHDRLIPTACWPDVYTEPEYGDNASLEDWRDVCNPRRCQQDDSNPTCWCGLYPLKGMP